MPYISVKISRSDREKKKMKAVFKDKEGKTKTIHFGQKGASDFTIHKDEERKQRYLDRHKKSENWNKPDTAGSLSRWILWNKPSLRESINDFKRKFNLH